MHRHLPESHLIGTVDPFRNKYHLYVLNGSKIDLKTHKQGPLLHVFHQRTSAHVCNHAGRH